LIRAIFEEAVAVFIMVAGIVMPIMEGIGGAGILTIGQAIAVTVEGGRRCGLITADFSFTFPVHVFKVGDGVVTCVTL
jgi:hypothetical protein